MKQDIIYACKYIVKHTTWNIQTDYCGHAPSNERLRDFECRAYELIATAGDNELSESYDECVECGIAENDMTAEEVLKNIGNKAPDVDGTINVCNVHILKDNNN